MRTRFQQQGQLHKLVFGLSPQLHQGSLSLEYCSVLRSQRCLCARRRKTRLQAADYRKPIIAWNIQAVDGQERELRHRFGQLAEREERISAEIEQLKLSPEQRNRPKSSIVWSSGGTTFQMQAPE